MGRQLMGMGSCIYLKTELVRTTRVVEGVNEGLIDFIKPLVEITTRSWNLEWSEIVWTKRSQRM